MTLPRSSRLSSSRQRDPESARFEALIREHYSNLVNFVAQFVQSADDAEDIVQDVFVRMWDRRDEDQQRDVVAYLYRAARNRAVSLLRHKNVVLQFRHRTVADAGTPAPNEFDAAEEDEILKALTEAIKHLSPAEQEVFTLSRDLGLSYAQIAQVREVSVRTVERQMGHALKTLRGRMLPWLPIGLMLLQRLGERLLA